jgi:hypothetical protein
MDSPRRLQIGIAEVVVGALCGLALGGLGLLLGRLIGTRNLQAGGGWADLVGAVAGAAGGYLLGVVLGTTLVSRRLTNHGSFLAALLGAVVGGLLTFALLRLVDMSQYSLALPILFAFLTSVGATVTLQMRFRR